MITKGQFLFNARNEKRIVIEISDDQETFKTKNVITVKSNSGSETNYQEGTKTTEHSISEIGTSLFNNEKISRNEFSSNASYKNKRNVKIDEILAFFQNNFCDPFPLDREQAIAVGLEAQNILITARAGSGKTRILVGKILFLIEKCNVLPNNILVLAFNKNVPLEIQKRLQEDIKSKKSEHSFKGVEIKNFHQMAKMFAKYNGKILNDDKARFIKLIIEDLKDNQLDFKENVYRFFRSESMKIDKRDFQNPENYYTCIRNLQHRTLKGENVKSVGEKWIADFLFEHSIDYDYEHEFYTKDITENTFQGNPNEQQRCVAFLNKNIDDYHRRKTIKPDFYLKNHYIAWEHWGIDEKDSSAGAKERVRDYYDMSWDEYKNLMDWKRSFWNPIWRKRLKSSSKYIKEIVVVKKLIETTVADIPNAEDNRTIFEQKLECLLNNEGIIVKKRDKAELIGEVWDKAIDRFSKMMLSFIDKYQQNYFNQPYSVIEEEIEDYRKDERVYTFLKLGLSTLKKYEEVLKTLSKPERFKEFEQCYIDFNQLLARAVEYIDMGEADQELKRLEYILIDEYQDFSGLFYKFIASMQSRNPSIHLYCVGDTWQAINRFMGANTSYFNEFDDYFSNSEVASITTNYRSAAEIVLTSNKFMKACAFREKPAKTNPQNNERGFVYFLNINDSNCVWLEYREEKKESNDFIADSKYIELWTSKENSYTDYIAAKYFKKCVEIIDSIKNKGEVQSVLILHRKNDFRDKYKLKEFKSKLTSYIRGIQGYSKEDYPVINVETIHRSKGLEADCVIILEANTGIIPLVHPDNALYSIFGENSEVAIEDEMRLFYVALTRAKKNLYLLYEDDKKSEFVAKIVAPVK